MSFSGRLEGGDLVGFARERAARLSLGLTLHHADAARMTVSVTGPEPLVDAFEMACSLGPLDCVVLDVTRPADLGADRDVAA
jgi:hypothetical protein